MTSRHLALLLLALAGVAHGADLTKKQILARAKACSQPFCEASPEGCDFTIARNQGEWLVKANPIKRDDSGERVYHFHTECTFVFSPEGVLLKELQWPWLNSAKGCGGSSTFTATCPPL